MCICPQAHIIRDGRFVLDPEVDPRLRRRPNDDEDEEEISPEDDPIIQELEQELNILRREVEAQRERLTQRIKQLIQTRIQVLFMERQRRIEFAVTAFFTGLSFAGSILDLMEFFDWEPFLF